jgi:CRISPR/Cas system-associated endonuclease Cas1
MRALLLTDYGTCLKTRDRRLVLQNQDSGERKEWLPTEFGFDAVIAENLGGFVTFPALRWLASNGVSLTMLNFDGAPVACWLPDYPMNAANRLVQMEAFFYRRLPVARFILEAKLGHAVPEPRSINDLLTFEAREAERYWTTVGIVRDYPHARDPANACLNYAYGLLESRARLAIHRASLEPSIGFLHEWRERKPSLAFDLMEPFRAETTKIALGVKKELNSRDYGEVFGHGLKLRPEGAHRLVTAFSRAFSDKEMERFTSRLILQFGTSGHAACSSPGPRRSDYTGALRDVSSRGPELPTSS